MLIIMVSRLSKTSLYMQQPRDTGNIQKIAIGKNARGQQYPGHNIEMFNHATVIASTRMLNSEETATRVS
jgi:hypothetical protein